MRIAAEAQGSTYLTASADAQPVQVFRSSAPRIPVADQALVDLLGTLVHGPELGALRVHVGAPAEINKICGGGRVVACYAVGANRMYVPDQAVEGAPLEYVLAHEYGHHIASWRSNAPWDAVDWGPKHWASAMRVCTYVRRGRALPRRSGRRTIRDDPGEGFADSYAHLSQPSVPWQFNALMRPTDAAFSAIRRDVLRPWAGPRKRTFHGRLGARPPQSHLQAAAQAGRQRPCGAARPAGSPRSGGAARPQLRHCGNTGRGTTARLRRRMVPAPAGRACERDRPAARGPDRPRFA